MTEGQFAAILGAITAFLGSLIATVRWGVGRITVSIDGNTAAYRESAKAQLEQAVHFAELSTKIDAVTDWVHEHTPVNALEYRTPTDLPRQLMEPQAERRADQGDDRRRRVRTPAQQQPGYRSPRPGTNHDD
jgi:hypothetical protein